MNLNELYEQRNNFFLNPPASLRFLALIFILVGIAAFVEGQVRGNGTETWGALLFNLFFFFSLALGGMAMSAILDVVNANWGRPLRRIWEGFGSFLPIAAILFAVFLICVVFDVGGAGQVYKWVENPAMLDHFWGKRYWLGEHYMVIRALGILFVLTLLTLWQLKNTISRDMKFVAGNKDEAVAEGAQVQEKMRFWSGGILIIYGVGLTFFGIDLIKSLNPLWFSTLFGGWQFAIMMQTLFALSLLVMFSLKGSNIGSMIKRQQFHDCGKLMFGFSCFFAYTTFSHVLTYWYGNMPEETEYYIHRLHEPWLAIVLIVPVTCFILPLYIFLSKAAKWTGWIAVPLATIILLGQWLTNFGLVMPEVKTVSTYYIPFTEIGLFLGMMGLFFTTFFWFGKRYPMVVLADPLLLEAYDSH